MECFTSGFQWRLVFLVWQKRQSVDLDEYIGCFFLTAETQIRKKQCRMLIFGDIVLKFEREFV